MITPVCLLMARGERPRKCVRLHEPDHHPSLLAPRLQAESPRCGCHAAPLYCVGDFCLGEGSGQDSKLAVGDIWVKRGQHWQSLRYQETEKKKLWKARLRLRFARRV